MAIDPAFASIDDGRFAAFKRRLDRLGSEPPQVMLMEGGNDQQRLAAALYWACRLNCPDLDENFSPCLQCPTCAQIAALEYLDVLAFDGRISNREDEEHPGLIRAFNVANIRELKSSIKVAQRGQGLRVVIFMGLESSRSEAANALLKTLEEPSPSTSFVLLSSQRERLLPTLVSRSNCLTLPWPDPDSFNEDLQAAEASLLEFFKAGQGYFTKTATKAYGETEARLALACLQKSLVKAMAGNFVQPRALESILQRLNPTALSLLGAWCEEAGQALNAQVTPSRVMEAFLAKVYITLKEQSQ